MADDIKIRSDDYWTKRAEVVANRHYTQGDKSLNELRTIFKSANDEMKKEILFFYDKYGKVQKSPTFTTLADGTKVISGYSEKLVVPPNVANVKLKQGTRLIKLQNQLDDILRDMAAEQQAYMFNTLNGIASSGYYDNMYEIYRGIGIGQSFNLLTPTVIKTLVLNPVNGQDFSTRIWNNNALLQNQVNQTLSSGIIQGKSNNQMAKELSDKMGSGYKVAKRLIDTEVTNTYNQASKLSYEESGVVSQYKYVATLDNRTSDICTELDGQVFDLEDAVTGLNYPPMHVNCRSTTKAYFEPNQAGLTRIARGLDGNTFTVPATMDVKNFKAIYVDKTLSRKAWDNGKRA